MNYKGGCIPILLLTNYGLPIRGYATAAKKAALLVDQVYQVLDAEYVGDGNLITSRMPDALPAFCKAMLKALAGN